MGKPTRWVLNESQFKFAVALIVVVIAFLCGLGLRVLVNEAGFRNWR